MHVAPRVALQSSSGQCLWEEDGSFPVAAPSLSQLCASPESGVCQCRGSRATDTQTSGQGAAEAGRAGAGSPGRKQELRTPAPLPGDPAWSGARSSASWTCSSPTRSTSPAGAPSPPLPLPAGLCKQFLRMDAAAPPPHTLSIPSLSPSQGSSGKLAERDIFHALDSSAG